jgi:2'-5' RNA ligase
VRLFLALNLPRELREAAHLAAAPLRDAAPALAWTPAERLHLTVKFLGEQPEAAVAPLVEAHGTVAGGHPPAPLALERVGAFPGWRRARVLWLGVRPEPRLELLHHDVEVACAALGYPIEGRAFRPHVTVGRVRAGGEPPDVRALARAARGVHFRAEVEAPSLDLMLSAPAPGGPRYTRLAALALAGLTRAP